MLTKSPAEAPEKSADVTLTFEQGTPVAVDGERLGPAALVEKLNVIAGEHGVGRIDLVENRFVGMKSRGCYETPGGTIIVLAHREIEALTLDRSTSHYKQKIALDYADIVYNGLWFTPLRESLDAFVNETQKHVTGEVTMRLYKGHCEPVSRKSPYSLYSLDIASFTMGAAYDQKDSRGFINLIGLPITVRAAVLANKIDLGCLVDATLQLPEEVFGRLIDHIAIELDAVLQEQSRNAARTGADLKDVPAEMRLHHPVLELVELRSEIGGLLADGDHSLGIRIGVVRHRAGS
jgi:hypothetical protein